MSNICIITSLNNKLLDNYAYNFLETYNLDYDLYICSEEYLNLEKYIIKNKYLQNDKLKVINLFNLDNNFYNFINDNSITEITSKTNYDCCNNNCSNYCFEHINNKKCKNTNCNNMKRGFMHCLNHHPFTGDYLSEKDNLLNIINMTKKFSYKVFSILNIYNNFEYKYYIWIDSDVIFKEKLTNNILLNLINDEEFILGYLKRYNTYLEAGFLIFNKNFNTNLFLNEIQELYLSNNVYYLQQSHDAFVFNLLIERFIKKDNEKYKFIDLTYNYCINNDLTGNINIIEKTILGKYILHSKGNNLIAKKNNDNFILIGNKIKKPHRVTMINNIDLLFNIKFYISHSFCGTPNDYSYKITNSKIDNTILINRSIFNDLCSNPWHTNEFWEGNYERKCKIWPAETIYLESYNVKNMFILGECDENTFNKRLQDMKIILSNEIIIGNKYICIALDRIGGWYLKKDTWKKDLKRITKLIKKYINIEIQIRLHPKNRDINNFYNNSIIDFIENDLKLKINVVDLDTLISETYCLFLQHSYLAYNLFIKGKIVFCLNEDSFYYKYCYNIDNINLINNINNLDFTEYFQKIKKLFRIIINQSIFIDGTESKQLENIINKYVINKYLKSYI